MAMLIKVFFEEGLIMMKFEEIIRNNKITMGEAIAELAKITDAPLLSSKKHRWFVILKA